MSSTETSFRRFFLTKSDLTEDAKANKIYAYLDKAAGFFFRPARHLFNGHEVKWVRQDKNQGKTALVTSSSSEGATKFLKTVENNGHKWVRQDKNQRKTASSSEGATKFLKTVGSIGLLIPFTLIGSCFELVPFAMDKRTRRYKKKAAHASNVLKFNLIFSKILPVGDGGLPIKIPEKMTDTEMKAYVLESKKLGIDLYHSFIKKLLDPNDLEGIEESMIDDIEDEILYKYIGRRHGGTLQAVRENLKNRIKTDEDAKKTVKAAAWTRYSTEKVTNELIKQINARRENTKT